jgi:hypothetical protein
VVREPGIEIVAVASGRRSRAGPLFAADEQLGPCQIQRVRAPPASTVRHVEIGQRQAVVGVGLEGGLEDGLGGVDAPGREQGGPEQRVEPAIRRRAASCAFEPGDRLIVPARVAAQVSEVGQRRDVVGIETDRLQESRLGRIVSPERAQATRPQPPDFGVVRPAQCEPLQIGEGGFVPRQDLRQPGTMAQRLFVSGQLCQHPVQRLDRCLETPRLDEPQGLGHRRSGFEPGARAVVRDAVPGIRHRSGSGNRRLRRWWITP